MTSNQSFRLSKEDIQNSFGKPDIARKQKDYSYEIRKVSDGSKIIIFYNGNLVSDSWRLIHLLKRIEFEHITIGKDTSDEVKNIDPYFIIIEGPENKGEAFTEHRLDDGGLATVEYKKIDSKWIVESIEYADQDPSKFTSKLNSQDLNSFIQ